MKNIQQKIADIKIKEIKKQALSKFEPEIKIVPFIFNGKICKAILSGNKIIDKGLDK